MSPWSTQGVGIRDEGSAIGHASELDFAGSGVSVSIVGGKAVVTIGGSASGANPKYLTPANPTNLTSTSYTHFGLGSTLNITPLLSGKIQFTIKYLPSAVGTFSGTNSFRVAYGTGTPPANAAAATGSVVGGTDLGGGAVAVGSTPAPIVRNVIVTGLTLGTAYWFDIQGSKNSGFTSMGMSSIEVTITELPY
jgi:hypothetical protein